MEINNLNLQRKEIDELLQGELIWSFSIKKQHDKNKAKHLISILKAIKEVYNSPNREPYVLNFLIIDNDNDMELDTFHIYDGWHITLAINRKYCNGDLNEIIDNLLVSLNDYLNRN